MKKNLFYSFLYLCAFHLLLTSCTAGTSNAVPAPDRAKNEIINDSLAFLKKNAQDGDLIVRLGDDFLSQQIKYMSPQDPSYSHVGIVVTKNGKQLVCHIYPDEKNADTVRYEPIESFLNRQKNIACGLYRYAFSAQERNAFLAQLDSFASRKVHFDKYYDLSTTNVYCSEMIYKALKNATNDRIKCEPSTVAPNMQRLLYRYFQGKVSKKIIAERKIITIDKLYLLPDCHYVTSFSLTPDS